MRRTDLKTLIAGAAAATLLAAALMAFASVPALAAQDDPAAPQAAPARAGRARVPAEPGLTEDQQKALRGLREARRTESRAFRDEMAKIRGEMRELVKDPEANRAQLDALIDRRAALRSGAEKAALRARAARAKIFTPEQRQRFEALRSRTGGRQRALARGVTGLRGRGCLARPGLAPGRVARLRALRHRPFLWRRR